MPCGCPRCTSPPFPPRQWGVAILVRRSIPFVFKSQTTDPGGSFILVTGTVNSLRIALLNIYVPNFNCPEFFCNVFNLLSEYNSQHIIVGGDFNCYFDALLERSPIVEICPCPQ